MEIKDLSNGLKSSLCDAVDTLKSKSKEVKLPDIKQAIDKPSKKIKNIFNKSASTDTSIPMQNITQISVHSAIKIIYLLMAADGKIHSNEEEKFDLICTELDDDFINSKQKIVKECKSIFDKANDSENYYNLLLGGVDSALNSVQKGETTFITPKHLVWNLISIAYSDENYNDTERKLLQYVAQRLNIDNAILLEMESSMLTAMDIEQELVWIKATNRPYLTVEPIVKELTERKNIVYESVLELIVL